MESALHLLSIQEMLVAAISEPGGEELQAGRHRSALLIAAIRHV